MSFLMDRHNIAYTISYINMYFKIYILIKHKHVLLINMIIYCTLIWNEFKILLILNYETFLQNWRKNWNWKHQNLFRKIKKNSYQYKIWRCSCDIWFISINKIIKFVWKTLEKNVEKNMKKCIFYYINTISNLSC